MLKNENIICISSIDWDFVWQGHQEIMSAFARNGNKVLFIENTGIRAPAVKDIPRLKRRFINWLKSTKGFRNEAENLFVYSPLVLPFPYCRIARWINKYILLQPLKRWMKAAEFHEPIIWTFLPTGIALDIINNLDRKLLVYYCIADFYELVDNARKVKRTEDELLKKSDLIFAQGKTLQDKCARLNDRVYIFPFGVNIEAFEDFQYNPNKIPGDIKGIKRPIIGYVGGIHRHIDAELIKFIAERHPEWSIVLIGPIQSDVSKIRRLQNVFLLGKKEFSSLPNYISEFDVAIIPYNVSGYTKTVFPTKLNEYHAMGKPVVSTDLPAISEFNAVNHNLVLVGKTYEEFTDCISELLNNKRGELINQRITSARRNNWTTRIAEMSSLLEATLEEKAKVPLDWQRSLLKFYRVTQRRIFKIGVVILSTYLLLFHTPIIWFVASPLKISQPPRKADCIVIFAGGVGESGKAGQGYQERVAYAVDLYKNGFARKMIFSSGYTYALRETDVMKALAVSFGIPGKDIILEKEAANTFQNVKFTNEIMQEKNWDSALVVSSPYHMRRVEMVYEKVAPEVKIRLTPVPKSRFYGDEKKVKMRHIKAIMHEYLGILYYFIKGYI